MVFSSVEFLLYFLPIFFILYALAPNKFKDMLLLAGSLIFYAIGDLRYLPLLMVSVCANYFVGLQLDAGAEGGQNKENKTKEELNDDKNRMRILATAIVANVGVLFLFKIFSNHIGLPLGISFYTFQVLSYLIDVYRGRIRREKDFLRMANYITMFPKLVSGPIVSYDEVEKELVSRSFTLEKLQSGLKLFTVGLVAKVLLADRVGMLWHDVQVTGFESISTPLAWLAALAYSMKIYFDFYGYSLMAVGIGRMLGFQLPMNFRTPYMATSVRDFYRRWHITLGKWFREYVYIPLGGSRKGELHTVVNLLIIWLITSIWHGNTPNFLIWGGLLWLCIVLERQLEKRGITWKWKAASHVYLWVVIMISWMCFAITDVSQLGTYLGRMFGVAEGISISAGDWLKALQSYGIWLVAAIAACTPWVERLYKKCKDHWAGKLVLAALFWICVWRLLVEGNNPFMYSVF